MPPVGLEPGRIGCEVGDDFDLSTEEDEEEGSEAEEDI